MALHLASACPKQLYYILEKFAALTAFLKYFACREVRKDWKKYSTEKISYYTNHCLKQ